MEPLLIYPDPVPPELAQSLDLGGYPWKAVAGEAALPGAEPEDGWSGAIVVAADDPEGAFALCRALRKRDLHVVDLQLEIACPVEQPLLEGACRRCRIARGRFAVGRLAARGRLG